jgi:predicted transcriptional regulator
LHEREICRRLNISRSTIRYHLYCLEKQEAVIKTSEGKCNRYFAQQKIGNGHKKILQLLRQRSTYQIVIFLLAYPNSSIRIIADYMEKDPRTVSFHLKKLMKIGLIESVPNGKERRFKLNNEGDINDLLLAHEESFVDDEPDGFP